MNEQGAKPEFDLTKREIDTVNLGRVHLLEHDWLERTGNLSLVNQEYLSPEENEKMGTILGSSYNTIMDFDHNQEPIMMAKTMANNYAYGTKRKVEKMYEEAYAANSDHEGPDRYFAEQRKLQKMSLRARLLGKFASRS